MSTQIRSYKIEGAWSYSHPFYYRCAYKAYLEYDRWIEQIHHREEELQKENPDMEPDELWSYIDYETDELWFEAYRAASSVQLFACMTIEAFLNHYGMKRLGEDFYKRNLERIGITEKLSILILTCQQKLLKKNDIIIKKTRALFDARNRLVHPKSKEINFERLDDFSTKHPKDLSVKEIINDMEDIISMLCEMDDDINRDFEFSKPNKILVADR